MFVIKPVSFALSSISELENDAPVWTAGATYNTADEVIRNGNIFVSTQDGNSGNDPDLENQDLTGARWLLRSRTNIRKFYDGGLTTATVGTTPLVIEVIPGQTFDSIALLNLKGTQTTVEVITGGTPTTIGTVTSDVEPVSDWWQWLNTIFAPNRSRVIFTDISGLGGSTVRLTIEGTTPQIGELVIGRVAKIGDTRLDAATKMRRRTFTSINTNDFGETTVTKRAIARDVTYSIVTTRDGFNTKAQFLDSIDGEKVVTYAVETGWEQFTNYGFITDWELPADVPNHFLFEITVQGVS